MVDTKRKNTYQTTTIGQSNDIFVNDIGNKELHQKFRIGISTIKDTKVGRAVITDQHIIDVLFSEQNLNAQQHNALNKYLEQIVKSGVFAKPQSMERIFGSGGNKPLPRAVSLVYVQRVIRENLSNEHEQISWGVMVKNPNKISNLQTQVMTEVAELLQNHFGVSPDSPVALFQQALLNPLR